nr:ArAe [Starmerella bombicola]
MLQSSPYISSHPPSVESSRETTPLLAKEKPAEPKNNAPPWHDVFICSLSYIVATLFVLSPLRSVLGSSGSKHTAATTAVWFHPARTLGNLIEVLYYTVELLALSLTVCLCAMGSVRLSHFLNFPQTITTIMLICWLSGTLGAIGIMKVRASNQSFNTASSAAIIFLVSALVREDDAQFGALPLSRLLNYLEMVAIGAGVSTMTSLLFYRKTSISFLTNNNHELGRIYAAMLEVLVASFGSDIDPTFATAKIKANTMLTQLSQHKKYAGYEILVKSRLPWARCTNIKGIRQQYRSGCDQLASLQKQSMHLGGMMHCASVVTSLAMNENKTFLNRLRKPMLNFAKHVALYIRDSQNTTVSNTDIQCLLRRYTHTRDKVLRNNDTKHLDNRFEAACILFAHLLQDIAEEMCSTGEQRASSSTPEFDGLAPTKIASLQNDYTKVQFNQLTEALSPTRKAATPGLGPKLWKFLRILRNLDVRHGIRVCLGATVLCIPAFIPEYRSLFQKWHGEWALITFMIILARNLGAMTHNIPLRLVGTSIGALVGIVANELFNTDPLPLFVVGFLVSLGCYRRILSKVNPVFGRFILLSYNLVCLYNFSMVVDNPDDTYYDGTDPIYDIAFHRVVSVIVGILWAVFVTLTIWPHSARQALRADLCIQWMRIGMVWKSDPLGLIPVKNSSSNPPVLRLRGITPEHELQEMMLELDVLLANSPNEFRLRGKFNAEPYKRLLESTQVILDAFHSISVMIDEEPLVTPREQDFVNITTTERRELCHLLFLQFYTASASVRLGFPVPEYLPGPEHPLGRLADKIGARRFEEGASKPPRSLSEESYDFVLFYSYITVVMTVSAELKRIHEALREIFGSLDDEILFAYV